MVEPKVISEAVYDRWLTPVSAIKLLSKTWDRSSTIRWMMLRLQGGLIKACAKHAFLGEDCHTFMLLGPKTWDAWPFPVDSDFWKFGDGSFSVQPENYGPSISVRLYEVRFCRNDILPHVDGRESEDVKPPSPPKSRRGAKRKDWWDILWIEMIRRIEADTLHPKNQAELQETLEEYVSNDLGENYGDSTLKPMASNLFKYLEERRGKIKVD